MPKGTGAILGGTIVGQASVLLATPLLTRIYTPSEIGALVLGTTIVSILGTTAAMRIDSLIPLPSEEAEAAGIIRLGISAAMGVSLLTYVIGLPMLIVNDERIGTAGILIEYWHWVALGVLGVALYEVVTGFLLRTKNVKSMGIRGAVQGLGQSGVQIIGGVAALGGQALLAGLPTGRLLACLPSIPLLVKYTRGATRQRHILKWHYKYLQKSAIGVLVNASAQQLPILVLGVILGSYAVGLLGMAVRLLAVPTTVLGQAVSRAFQSDAARLIREGRGGLAPLARQTFYSLTILSLLPYAVVALVAPRLFELLLGAEWRGAGEMARVLVPGLWVQFAVSPVSRLLLLLRRPGVQIIIDLVRTLLSVGVPVLVWNLGAGLQGTLLSLSLVMALSYLGMWLLVRWQAMTWDASAI